MQRGVNARVGDEKQGDWGESQGWKRSVPVLCVMLLGAQHDKQLLVYTSLRVVVHRASRPNSNAIIEQVLLRPYFAVFPGRI